MLPRDRAREGAPHLYDDREARKAKAVEARAKGLSVRACAEEAGVTENTLAYWQRLDPGFKAAMRAALARPMPAHERPEAVALEKNFAAWRKAYFGYDTYSHQQQIVDALDSLKPREIVMILVWPEAGKTTTLTDWVCKKLGEDPNHRITYLSEASGLSQKVVNRVKNRMTDFRTFPMYISKYGPFYREGQEKEGKPWTKDYFSVYRADHDEQDYSLEARAWKSAAYGMRIDTLIIDDVQSLRSLSQTQNLYDTLRQTYLTRGRQMRTIILGTRIGIGDIYERMLDDGLVDRLVRLPAADFQGNPTVPEMWENESDLPPREFMEKIKTHVGNEMWATSYQQNPMLTALATFSEQLVEDAKDHDRRCARPGPGTYITMSLDPALGGGNALLVCAHHPDKLEIIDGALDYDLSQVEQILTRIAEYAGRYQPVELIVERDAFQKGLANDDRLHELGKRFGFRVHPHTTTGNKADPILGVASMAGSFIRGEVRIPWGDDYAQRRMEPLCHQLRSWRPNMPGRLLVQDMVMSLWFNWRDWMSRRQTINKPPRFSRKGLPWEPMRAPLTGARN